LAVKSARTARFNTDVGEPFVEMTFVIAFVFNFEI
jgi:hypothetical protein